MHRNNELMVKKMDTNFGNWDFDKSNDIPLPKCRERAVLTMVLQKLVSIIHMRIYSNPHSII